MNIVYYSFEIPNKNLSPIKIKDVVRKAGLKGVYCCDTNEMYVMYLKTKIQVAVEIIFEEDDDAVEYILSCENYIYPNSDWVKYIYDKDTDQWVSSWTGNFK